MAGIEPLLPEVARERAKEIVLRIVGDHGAVAAILEGPEAFAKVGLVEGVGISLIRFRCNCGGLCDSRGPCPMGGDRYEWTEIGKAVAALFTQAKNVADGLSTRERAAAKGDSKTIGLTTALALVRADLIDDGTLEPTDLGRMVQAVLASEVDRG